MAGCCSEFHCLLDRLPEQTVFLEDRGESSRVAEIRETGTDRASDQYILIKIQSQRIVIEHPLQKLFKRERSPAELREKIQNFQHLFAIFPGQRNRRFQNRRMGWNKEAAGKSFDPFQSVQKFGNIIEEKNVVLVQNVFSAHAVG